MAEKKKEMDGLTRLGYYLIAGAFVLGSIQGWNTLAERIGGLFFGLLLAYSFLYWGGVVGKGKEKRQ